MDITRHQAIALSTRADLVEKECHIVIERRISWRGRLAELGDYGNSGGSSADRRAIVEAFAAMEAS